MKTPGARDAIPIMARVLDDYGKITIPKHVRAHLGIHRGDLIEIWVIEKILASPPEDQQPEPAPSDTPQ